MSGEYLGTELPTGVLADAYLQKGGEHSPEVLVTKIRDLLENSPLRANIIKTPRAAVWIPLNGKSYFVLTCPECLRSFSLPVPGNAGDPERERKAKCESCGQQITYVLDSGVMQQVKRAAE
jgi:hypothetical protein